jgi:hypothetical protein
MSLTNKMTDQYGYRPSCTAETLDRNREETASLIDSLSIEKRKSIIIGQRLCPSMESTNDPVEVLYGMEKLSFKGTLSHPRYVYQNRSWATIRLGSREREISTAVIFIFLHTQLARVCFHCVDSSHPTIPMINYSSPSFGKISPQCDTPCKRLVIVH